MTSTAMGPNKIVLAGGTGTIGRILQAYFSACGHEVVVLTRDPAARWNAGIRFVHWNGRTPGPWCRELEGASAVIGLAGRSVDCRYTAKNKAAIRDSRVNATHALGRAIAACAVPPPLWANLSTATIYRHAEDRAMNEHTGEIGSGFSVSVAQAWEEALFAHRRAGVRQVAVRCAMVLSPYGGAFPRFSQLVRCGLGGRHGSGRQYVSWVHEADVARFFQWLLDTPRTEGIINLAAPHPVPEQVLLNALRDRIRPLIALPTPAWLLAVGAFLLRTETELVLKSRRVVPTRALELGFRFAHPTIDGALDALFAQGGAPAAHLPEFP